MTNPNTENVDNTGIENTGVEPGSETDRLLDAATRRIGNEPNDDGSFGDFDQADQDAVDSPRDVTTGEHGATPDQLRTDVDRTDVDRADVDRADAAGTDVDRADVDRAAVGSTDVDGDGIAR